ncbi:hypothetical protein [Flavobacterium sp.]|uniref:hypothetical protein n=1 Tax=Flavobacterium sp. TaxID=239 RepID=UPI00286A9C2C|nr:hypothetical protein [Flavobacterium sp.]
MKNIISLLLILSSINMVAQKEIFDIATYSIPQGWKKQTSESTLQFTKEDANKDSYCAITLFKSMPSTATVAENFDLTWKSVVKQMVSATAEPQLQPTETENGWETQTGFATFETEGSKSVVYLITSSDNVTMMSMLILTNSDVYQTEITNFIESIILKKSKSTAKKPIKNEVNINRPVSISKNDGFAFTTTNFDDGWNSIVQEDWIEVKKENIKVLLHYPNKTIDSYSSDLMAGLKYAWDMLVAPKYSSATNMEFKPLFSWQSIEFAEAEMVEKATGKTVYVVFFKKHFSSGSGRYIEFIFPDRFSFENEFGIYTNQALASSWDKMANMTNYNKFAVAATDLKGKWTSNFSGMTQYVNAYTGADAGANTHASNENFEFGNGNTYKWDLGVASGFVGNIKFQSVKSAGKFTVLNNWQVKFSDIEGKPKTYKTQFTCIKGARVLWVGETGFGKKD